MNLLLDTHGLIWFLTGDAQLSPKARLLIEDESDRILVSVASLWEMAIKYSIGKLNIGRPYETLFPSLLNDNDMEVLGITIDHLKIVCNLPMHHRDPFDRLLIAQALADGLSVISADMMLDIYGVARLW